MLVAGEPVLPGVRLPVASAGIVGEDPGAASIHALADQAKAGIELLAPKRDLPHNVVDFFAQGASVEFGAFKTGQENLIDSQAELFSAAVPLRSILDLRLPHGLPLHIGGSISAAAFQRHDVIDHVAPAALWIASLFHEFIPSGSTPRDFAVRIPLSDRRFFRNG